MLFEISNGGNKRKKRKIYYFLKWYWFQAKFFSSDFDEVLQVYISLSLKLIKNLMVFKTGDRGKQNIQYISSITCWTYEFT